MAKILVTGAAGFIGSNLTLALEALGHDVLAVDSFKTGRRDNLRGFRGEFREHDVTTGVDALDASYACVFHHGDITDPRHGSDADVRERNVAGFQNMLALCRRRGARFVYASTAGLYGNGTTPMREDQPKDILTAYGRSKLEMDELGASVAEIPVIGLRYFNVFGPREAHKGRAASMVYHLTQQIQRGERPRLFKHGEHRRDFIYVKDVVAANLKAMTAPSGVYNVGTGIASPFNEVAAAVKAALGVTVETEYIDMPYDPATYQNHTEADTRLATQRLGFTAEWALRPAVADYVAWMRDNL